MSRPGRYSRRGVAMFAAGERRIGSARRQAARRRPVQSRVGVSGEWYRPEQGRCDLPSQAMQVVIDALREGRTVAASEVPLNWVSVIEDGDEFCRGRGSRVGVGDDTKDVGENEASGRSRAARGDVYPPTLR
jgi:hypothetical protein